jgi:hypothetical protein
MRTLKMIENASVALVKRNSPAPESGLQFQVDRAADNRFFRETGSSAAHARP